MEQQQDQREAQHNWLLAKGLKGVVDKSVNDLRAQVNRSLQGFLGEVESLRAIGNMPERVLRLEEKLEELFKAFLDQDIAELTRVVRAESQARIGLSESLDAYRQAYLQTTTELRAELDGIVEKQTRGVATAEDRGRIVALERSLAEVRNVVSTRAASSRLDSRGPDALLTKDIQELSGRVVPKVQLDSTSLL